MRTLFAILLAVGLVVVAAIFFMAGSYLMAGAFLAGALAVMAPMLLGRESGGADAATAAIEFVSNPAGAIVDAAVDRLGEAVESQRKAKPEEPGPSFDVDAAFDRYMARRTNEAGAEAVPVGAASRPHSFGRKSAGRA